jgi:hypothetical protein
MVLGDRVPPQSDLTAPIGKSTPTGSTANVPAISHAALLGRGA